MINIPTESGRRCDGWSRREYLRIGTVGVFGLSLPEVLRAQALESAKPKGKGVSCILLWLSGGPSQLETFDPKPDAPAEIRGEFKTISTGVPGVHFTEYLPRVAKQFKNFSVIRSLTHNQGTHGLADQLILRCHTPSAAGVQYPSQGSVVSHVFGYRNGIPPYVFVGKMGGPDGIRKRLALDGGALGDSHNPLEIGDSTNDPEFSVKDVTLAKGVDYERLMNRRKMLGLFDRYHRNVDTEVARFKDLDSYYERAFSLVTSPQAKKAFSLDEEPTTLRDSYGRTMFGQSCLLARRLVEAGVKFVTVGMPNWDTHTYNCKTMKEDLLPVLDNAYAALLQDLQDRGMLDSTLVVCMGEFGRTPKINAEAGRDHWPSTQVVAIGGGGIKRGLIVGATNARSEYPIERPLSVQDLGATIYHALGIPASLEYTSTVSNRPIKVLDSGEPIAELI